MRLRDAVSGEALRREDALRARSRAFRSLMDRTYADLAQRMNEVESPYAAVSGGKDSLVALVTASDIRPGITALWSDDELEWEGQHDAITTQCQAAGARLVMKMCSPDIQHGGWFHPWTDRPFWRDPHTDTLVTMQTTEQWAQAHGYDAAITGVRAQESLARRAHGRKRGTAYERLDRMIVLQPLLWWTGDDVWAYIAMRELPYHELYDVMSRARIPRHQQRIGPLCLTPRWIVQAVDPTLPGRLEARYGNRWS